MAIRAIETRYAGCRFRSRLEARWAVLFDALGIEWNYERQGFETQHGWYLPDFWLPEAKAWIEVKGGKSTRRDQLKCEEVAREEWKSGHRFRILVGDIPRAPFLVSETGPYALLCQSWTAIPGTTDPLPKLGEPFEWAPMVSPGDIGARQGFIRTGWVPVQEKYKDLPEALTKARSARFEHGEFG
ncbi:hypothetical protein [Streptomyces albogriseolus]